jgi:hypothetical protein
VKSKTAKRKYAGKRARAEVAGGAAADGTIGALGNRLKALFEGKRWRELGEGLDLGAIWFLQAPKSMAEALALAEEVLGGASEVDLSLVRILRSDGSESEAGGSYTCCLAWLETESFEHHEVQFDLHLGFRRGSDDGDGRGDGEQRWRLAYLGVTPATPEMAPAPGGEAEPAGPASREDGGSPIPWPAEPGGAPEPAAGDPVMVYVPVLLPTETVQALLRGARRKG